MKLAAFLLFFLKLATGKASPSEVEWVGESVIRGLRKNLFEKFGRRNVPDKLIMARLSDDAGTAAFPSMFTADQAVLN